jgi:hypothetical protein
VNESQLKFLKGTRHISQNQSNVSLFYFDQDHIGIEKLLTLRTELVNLKTQRKPESVQSKVTIKSTTTLFPYNQFIEHLMGVSKKTIMRAQQELGKQSLIR